jgi:GGDEF domain-containing protein
MSKIILCDMTIDLYDRKKLDFILSEMNEEDKTYILGTVREMGDFVRQMQLRISDLEEKVAELGTQVDQDYLIPNIYNRVRFEKDLEEAVTKASNGQKAFSLIMIDVDHFKQYNDTQGHPKGDKLLRTLARSITSCLRRGDSLYRCDGEEHHEESQKDSLYRYGGEEFAIILPGANLTQGTKAALRIRKEVEEYFKRAGNITISLGVSAYASQDTNGPIKNKMLSVIKQADRALYQAKEQGRNRVRAYTPRLAPSGTNPQSTNS